MAADEKLDWIYKNANSLVNREDYLLGRKVDKALEQLNDDEKEKKIVLPTPKNHVEHECIPPSIRDFNKIVQAEQVDLSAKLQEDPLVTIRKREEEARRKFLQNPVQLKKLQDALEQQEKKKKKKSKPSDLDEKIKEKIKFLKNSGSDKRTKKKENKDALNTILMHKFNALKDKLSDSDLNDILNGKIDSSSDESVEKKKKRNHKSSDSSSSDSEDEGYSKHKVKTHKKVNKSKKKDVDKNRKMYKHSKDKVHRRSRSKSRNRYTSKHNSSRKHCSESDSSDYDSKTKYSSNKNKDMYKRAKHKIQSRDSSEEGLCKRYRKSSKDNSEKDLDEKIMEKLKMLRQATEISTKENTTSGSSHENVKRIMLPEKPTHLIGCTNSNNSSSSDEDNRVNGDSEEEKCQKRRFGLVSADGKKITMGKTNKALVVNTKIKKASVLVKPEKKVIKKLTEEEKEKLRKEMMQNAEIRDKEREENLRKYRETEKEEDTKIMKYDTTIIHNQLMKAAKHTSIEDRIKSNLNNIQRSSKHMSTNFSKR
ncbi:hypothetical protein GWI33_000847 [Rhynchophorus ferrugineus]|uniref:Pre-mRNA-splicing factor CWC25-like protein n=1 Tax=Rhynchophorus ferrugineus TaxID=354439 RepID=A0A834MLY3_RHYFE|nr:hypothetical protein GWI33_000847 [Rhynchophorus ferrugineus]